MYVCASVTCLLMALLGWTEQLAQLEGTVQKQGHALRKLHSTVQTDSTASHQDGQMAVEIKRLETQLAELKTQVQAEDKARHLLDKLSGTASSVSTYTPISYPNTPKLTSLTRHFHSNHAKYGLCIQ